MRKQLIWVAAFLLLAFWLDRIFGYFLKETVKSSQFRYSKLYNSIETNDVLFVGNSRGLNFYQPEAERLLNASTANLSYNGMPADLAKCLVMDYLDRHVAPKVMVVDVTMCDRDNDGLKAGFNVYAPFSTRLDTLLRGMQDKDDAWKGRKIVYGGKVSHLYRHNSEIFQRILYHRNQSDKDWIVDRVIGAGAAEDTSMKSYQVRMFPNQVAHLKEMIDFAESKGVSVKLVINPYFRPFAVSPSIRDSFLMPLKQHVEAVTGKQVYDFSTAITEVDEIGDYQHINKKGSIHYMNILNENGLLQADPAALNILKAINGFDNEPQINTAPSQQVVFASQKGPIADTLGQTSVNFQEIPASPVNFVENTPSVKTPKSPVQKASVKPKTRRRNYRSDEGFDVDTLFSN